VYTEFWWGDLMERDHLENLGVNGRIILKCVLKKWDGTWTGLVSGSFECGNEPWDSIKSGDLLV
jgi:hypothetical protein